MYLVMKNLIQRVPIEYFNDCQNMILTSFPLIRLWSPRDVSFKSIGIKNFAYLIRKDFCVIYIKTFYSTHIYYLEKSVVLTQIYIPFFPVFSQTMGTIRVFRVPEKVAINFVYLLHISEQFHSERYPESYRKVMREHAITGEYITVGLHGPLYIEFGTRVLDYSVTKYKNLDVRPGVVCRGTIPNPKDEECPICCENVLKDVYVARMECNHIFHEACLLSWIKSGCVMCNHCPKCRHVIDSGRLVTVVLYDSSCHTLADILYNYRYTIRVWNLDIIIFVILLFFPILYIFF